MTLRRVPLGLEQKLFQCLLLPRSREADRLGKAPEVSPCDSQIETLPRLVRDRGTVLPRVREARSLAAAHLEDPATDAEAIEESLDIPQQGVATAPEADIPAGLTLLGARDTAV